MPEVDLRQVETAWKTDQCGGARRRIAHAFILGLLQGLHRLIRLVRTHTKYHARAFRNRQDSNLKRSWRKLCHKKPKNDAITLGSPPRRRRLSKAVASSQGDLERDYTWQHASRYCWLLRKKERHPRVRRTSCEENQPRVRAFGYSKS